jgi:hypothetical protein
MTRAHPDELRRLVDQDQFSRERAKILSQAART